MGACIMKTHSWGGGIQASPMAADQMLQRRRCEREERQDGEASLLCSVRPRGGIYSGVCYMSVMALCSASVLGRGYVDILYIPPVLGSLRSLTPSLVPQTNTDFSRILAWAIPCPVSVI